MLLLLFGPGTRKSSEYSVDHESEIPVFSLFQVNFIFVLRGFRQNLSVVRIVGSEFWITN